MQFTIISILITFSLTLLTACGLADARHVPDIEAISADEVRAKVSGSKRPYILLSLYQRDCPLCRGELPELSHLSQQLKEELEIMLISVDSTFQESQAKRFLADGQIDFPTYHFATESAQSLVSHYYPQWDGNIPLNLLLTHRGALIEATVMIDSKEVQLLIHEHQSFH